MGERLQSALAVSPTFTMLHRASMAPSTAARTVTAPRSATRTATTRAREGRRPATTPTNLPENRGVVPAALDTARTARDDRNSRGVQA